jgi:hypothetical protein
VLNLLSTGTTLPFFFFTILPVILPILSENEVTAILRMWKEEVMAGTVLPGRLRKTEDNQNSWSLDQYLDPTSEYGAGIPPA